MTAVLLLGYASVFAAFAIVWGGGFAVALAFYFVVGFFARFILPRPLFLAGILVSLPVLFLCVIGANIGLLLLALPAVMGSGVSALVTTRRSIPVAERKIHVR